MEQHPGGHLAHYLQNINPTIMLPTETRAKEDLIRLAALESASESDAMARPALYSPEEQDRGPAGDEAR